MSSHHDCLYEGCEMSGKYRCSRCQIAYYCSPDHQKLHWKEHKPTCTRHIEQKTNETVVNSTPDDVKDDKEKRICRCMFCGESLLLESEEAAIEHMGVCPALQEQLQSKEPITVPSMVKAKMNMK
mmetsp:Transcript_15099/g.16377  ORF Transcript_15099/g.16377 Transcript_15099/m.16377 type:complete len:125 (-) Transcript_15099:229-603(-)